MSFKSKYKKNLWPTKKHDLQLLNLHFHLKFGLVKRLSMFYMDMYFMTISLACYSKEYCQQLALCVPMYSFTSDTKTWF